MPESAIAQNLRRIRGMKSLTQVELAELSGLSRAAYRNIETGKSGPRVSSLLDIAHALQVPVQQLVEPIQPLRAARFRSNKQMRSREQILVNVGRWFRNFDDLEEILEDRKACKLDDIRKQIKARKNRSVAAAALAREFFGLSAEEPVRDICGLLESQGIRVGEQEIASPGFFGLSIAGEEGRGAVVVNTWKRIPVERWIFTAAHELGHLILHQADYDVESTDEEQKHEEEANAFAGAFLMPDESFRNEWNDTSGLAFVDRVLKVKRIFSVSYRTVLYRLAPNFEQGNIWLRFQQDYFKRSGHTLLRADEPNALAEDAFRASFPEDRSADEPDKLSSSDFVQDRLHRLVRLAIEQEKITLGRGAEILNLPLKEMRALTASWIG